MKKLGMILLIVGLIALVFVMTKRSPKAEVRIEATEKVEEAVVTKLSEASNSDGSLKLIGSSRKSPEGRSSYAFKIVDTIKKTERVLYETVADLGSVIKIPVNSWSPDNKMVFVRLISPGGEDYQVFKANGEDFADGKKYLRVGDYWSSTKLVNKIQEISGWAGDDLMMVYTLSEDGSHGPAYWFVTSTRKFMQVREF